MRAAGPYSRRITQRRRVRRALPLPTNVPTCPSETVETAALYRPVWRLAGHARRGLGRLVLMGSGVRRPAPHVGASLVPSCRRMGVVTKWQLRIPYLISRGFCGWHRTSTRALRTVLAKLKTATRASRSWVLESLPLRHFAGVSRRAGTGAAQDAALRSKERRDHAADSATLLDQPRRARRRLHRGVIGEPGI